jgi:hypothetical protein
MPLLEPRSRIPFGVLDFFYFGRNKRRMLGLVDCTRTSMIANDVIALKKHKV